jgi:A/G-specific adenine glycosylase
MTDPSRFRRRLLAWFDRHQRDLPWRRDRDPYRIWVSEVMLQQTTVAAVVPYFERFLKRFPSLAALAAADEQDVLHLWQGLGYYRRARNLHAAARQIVADHGGQWPRDPADWSALPGVGRYIVGAVLSQAFDGRLPIVEANSQRVLCRLFGKPAPERSWLWAAATELLPRKRTGDFNQAMMELGALVCAPAPRCRECPVRADCRAFADGTQDRIPAKAKPPATVAVREVAVVVRRGPQVLIVQRPPDAGRWANMWQFPQAELRGGEAHAAAARRLIRSVGLRVKWGAELTTVRYAVTRFRMTLVALEAAYRAGRFAPGAYPQAAWVKPADLGHYPVSAAQRRLAEEVGRAAPQRCLF